ncbi:MAG: ribosomal protein S18-alanine N-acetyltransferase [Bryobacteraceae bacterium]
MEESSPEAAQWSASDYAPYRVMVAEVGGKTAGFAAMRETGPGEHELLNLAVAPEWRGQGVGWRLLETCVAHSVERGGKEMFLEVRESNVRAISLYERYGFQPVGLRPAYYEKPVEAGIVMRLRTC